MNSATKKFIIAIVVVIGLVVIFKKNQKPPISWEESYSVTDKNPYGMYILNKEIDFLFPKNKLKHVGPKTYTFLSQERYDTNVKTSLISIRNQTNFDVYLLDQLLDYVEKGNTALVFERLGSESLAESLKIHIVSPEIRQYKKDNYTLELTNKNNNTSRFTFENNNSNVFKISDSVKNKVKVLGYKTLLDGQKHPNLIEYSYGKGKIILGTDSTIFTNYNMLKSNNHLYIQGVLSYLPEDRITYFVTDKDSDSPFSDDDSILSFILRNKELRWAWYLCLTTLIVFVVFTAKRKQRVVPIIVPLTNTTVDFTKTVSNLYIQNKDYSDIINKSIIYNLEKIRRLYWIDTSKLDEKFVESYHIKTNKDRKDIVAYVNFVNAFRKAKYGASESDLIKFNKLTEKIID
ncbi:hypothetical protein NWE55_12300 [Myroides albus]|uniref:DUF4350 domain-containing protein n=1 Tax=Myroides albus TaxID=2562892 RepID=UPI002158BE10|nr:DUF4350 domain-containing protein [Myroides albus]UVD78896.1 hypothetical protein NWE55_12300 [Myroides albus]